MAMHVEHMLLIGALLLFASIMASKTSGRLGVPTLILFMAVGMIAGSDGLGIIYFDNAQFARTIGIIALVFILFSGGLDTKWESVRPILGQGVSLATVGVLFTAAIVGVAVPYFTHLTLLEGLLLGAIVSSTDAAAVFTILRSRNVRLKANLRPLLELESGSNDPMGFFLTVSLVSVIGGEITSLWGLVPRFFFEMSVGALAGWGMGRVMTYVLNRIKLAFDGLYPVLLLALVFFTYSATHAIGGNGFLAVYLAGVVLGNSDFIHKKSLIRFYDGQAWLVQIAMFLTLGLLVFPSQVVPVMGTGLLISVVLILVARPVAVFVSLAPFRGMTWRQKAFLSWVGLRGAVPIVFATYPLIAGLENAQFIFNVVFFAVLTSVLLQGSTLPFAARLLRVERPKGFRRESALDLELSKQLTGTLVTLAVPAGSAAVDHLIVDLHFPKDAQIILVERDGQFTSPDGATEIAAGDRLMVMAKKPDRLVPMIERLGLERVNTAPPPSAPGPGTTTPSRLP
ncbi:MAG: potassium/proton antiporter [Flavobacteriales bacterium]|nr:potassium/proton antiporter [Flavobacteriales bacterium]